MRLLTLLLLAMIGSLGACEPAEKKCARLGDAAAEAWTQYGQALQADLDATRAVLAAAKKKLDGEITQRHEAKAREHADSLHGTETSTAWYRTFLAAAKAECANDPECLELKVQTDEAERKIVELGKRIAVVKVAQGSAKADPEAAKSSADVITPDTEHAAAEVARTASTAAITACLDAK
jgi:hypothetical protein